MHSLANHIAVVPWVVAGAASLVAALIDLRSRRIPNRLTGPVLLGGLIWSACVAGGAGVGDALLGALIAGAPFIFVWLIGGGGAGDAKLMLGLGAWLGPRHAIVAALAVALAGGALALRYAIVQRRLLAALLGTGHAFLSMSAAVAHPERLTESESPQLVAALRGFKTVPYGVAIFGGLCAAATWVFICGD